jgi:HTH-type transcriptional regulator/antitoxin HigA
MDAEEGTIEADELDVLVTLIEAYEDVHYPIRIGPPDPVESIKAAMELRSLTRKDLEPLIGSRTLVAEVLGRKRELTLPMIRRLHDKLDIPLEVLVQPTQKKERRAKPEKQTASDEPRRRSGRVQAA